MYLNIKISMRENIMRKDLPSQSPSLNAVTAYTNARNTESIKDTEVFIFSSAFYYKKIL